MSPLRSLYMAGREKETKTNKQKTLAYNCLSLEVTCDSASYSLACRSHNVTDLNATARESGKWRGTRGLFGWQWQPLARLQEVLRSILCEAKFRRSTWWRGIFSTPKSLCRNSLECKVYTFWKQGILPAWLATSQAHHLWSHRHCEPRRCHL